ncbi:MAG TPA: hypothetical protein PLD47_16895 [Aggregatilineales bacterium]|nr:hypothetical protein [Anaerolineales bacterium]HRE49405.1 hypothetical protein [Aggregatilineales bacterium]
MRNRLFVFILLIGLLAACEGDDPPPPTRLPFEPAVIYSGGFRAAGAAQDEGQIALIITPTRGIAVVCGVGDGTWRALSGWFRGSVASGTLTTKPASATFTADSAEGILLGADGTRYLFQAIKRADTAQIAAGVQEGVYRADAITISGRDAPANLYVIVTDAERATLCGILVDEQGTPLSRVALVGIWQSGFSTFMFPDLPDAAGTPLAVFGIGTFAQIDGILME